jgi:hypothetical protein
MSGENSTTAAELLLEMWPQDDIHEVVYRAGGAEGGNKGGGLFPLIPKKTDFYEETRHIIVGYGGGQGIGGGFDEAKASKSADSQAEFRIPIKSYYSLFSIDRLLKKRAKKGKGSIINVLERKSRMALIGWRRDMSHLIFGNGGGAIGRLSAVTSTTGTLATTADVRKFERFMRLHSSTDDGA